MADATPTPETASYLTTARVGARVAGWVVEPGKADQELTLTAEEAAFALGEGTLVRKGGKLSSGFGDTSRTADALRADIAAERARYAAVCAQARDTGAADGPETAPAGTAKASEAPAGETAGGAKAA